MNISKLLMIGLVFSLGCGVGNDGGAPEVLIGPAKSAQQMKKAIEGTWESPCNKDTVKDADGNDHVISNRLSVTFKGNNEMGGDTLEYRNGNCQGDAKVLDRVFGNYEIKDKSTVVEEAWNIDLDITEVIVGDPKQVRKIFTIIAIKDGKLYIGFQGIHVDGTTKIDRGGRTPETRVKELYPEGFVRK